MDGLGRDPQNTLRPGEIPGHGLPDPNFEQGFPGGDPETRLERQEPEMAERGPDQTWGSSRVGSAIVLAFVQGLHSRLRISIGNPQDPAPVLGKLANRIHRRHLHQGEKECGRGHLGKSPLTAQGHQPGPGKEVREDLSHEDWDDKHGPSDHGSPVKSGSFHLVSEDETTEQQSDGLGSGKSKPSTRTARSVEPPHEDLPRRNMFQVVPSDEVLPPVGPLIVVASLRKTGNPPKRKLHLLDREGRAVGCGWSPDLSKISSMGKEDYENEVGELVQCSRCFLRFTLPNEWLFDVSQDPAVALDSDSSVSFGSLTDSSVDTASECDKVTLPSLERDGALLPLQ